MFELEGNHLTREPNANIPTDKNLLFGSARLYLALRG
jgi:hypothetical protein